MELVITEYGNWELGVRQNNHLYGRGILIDIYCNFFVQYFTIFQDVSWNAAGNRIHNNSQGSFFVSENCPAANDDVQIKTIEHRPNGTTRRQHFKPNYDVKLA